MFADLDRSDGTRDARSLTRLVTQFFGPKTPKPLNNIK